VAGLVYLDASAIVKLIRIEPESTALRRESGEWPELVTSIVGEIEVLRVTRRAGLAATTAERVLGQMTILALDEDVREHAALIADPVLRTLDAIHLATALSIADDLDGFVCYDVRLGSEARRSGLEVIAPA